MRSEPLRCLSSCARRASRPLKYCAMTGSEGFGIPSAVSQSGVSSLMLRFSIFCMVLDDVNNESAKSHAMCFY